MQHIKYAKIDICQYFDKKYALEHKKLNFSTSNYYFLINKENGLLYVVHFSR